MSLSAEQKDYLAEIAPGRFWMEIDELFEERFGFALGKSKIRYTLSRMGVRSNVVGREKGCDTPKSTIYKLGDEREDDKGVWVRVKEHGETKEEQKYGLWEKKQNLVWEEANGQPLPEDWVVMFADGDRHNFAPENLVAVPRRTSQIIYGMKLGHHDGESFETCRLVAEIRKAVTDKMEACHA